MARPEKLSKALGVDVRDYRHATSNQAMRHALSKHGTAAEVARGQKQLVGADFEKLPRIVREGAVTKAAARRFGPVRVEINATIDGDRFTYIGEVRARQRRIDMISMWKR